MADWRVVQWGRLPPPLGGVSRSIELTQRSLRAHGVPCDVIDPARPHRSPARYFRVLASPRLVGVVHCSRLVSIGRASWIARLSRHPTVCYLHASGPDETVSPAAAGDLRRFDHVWAANADLAGQVSRHGLECRLVSPYPRGARDDAGPRRPAAGDVLRVVAFCYRGESLYGLETVLDAMVIVRDHRPQAVLRLVLYGGGPAPLAARYREWGERYDWITVHEDLDDPDMTALLADSDVVVRPTLVDGDSLTVRQALGAGLRVVASDCSPRPAGVEVVPSAAASDWARAIEVGAPVSDGTGLGEPVDDALLSLVRGSRQGSLRA